MPDNDDYDPYFSETDPQDVEVSSIIDNDMIEKIFRLFPNAAFGVDNDGQILIYTGEYETKEEVESEEQDV